MLRFEEVDLDSQPDHRFPSPERAAELAMIRDEVRSALEHCLPKRYRKIIEWTNGINCHHAMTLEEIARSQRATRQRIVGLVSMAHRYLRHRCPHLATLLDD